MRNLALAIVLLVVGGLLGCRQSNAWYATNDAINTQMAATWTAQPVGASVGQLIAQDLGVCPTAPVVLCVAITATPPGPVTLPPVTPLPTATPTVTPTQTGIAPSPTQVAVTATISPYLKNWLKNPGFLGADDEREFNGVRHAVADEWEPFYCAWPYTTRFCPAPRIGTGNPAGLVMGHPEYGPSHLRERCVRLNQWGTRIETTPCQKWFLMYRAGFAGVAQTVTGLTPGMRCEAGAYVHSWSNHTNELDTGVWYASILNSDDARANSTWFVLVGSSDDGRLLVGSGPDGTPILTHGTLASRGFGYDDEIYDPPSVLISYNFTVTGPRVTVGFADARLWPFGNNDSYIDDAYLRCVQ